MGMIQSIYSVSTGNRVDRLDHSHKLKAPSNLETFQITRSWPIAPYYRPSPKSATSDLNLKKNSEEDIHEPIQKGYPFQQPHRGRHFFQVCPKRAWDVTGFGIKVFNMNW